MARSSSKYATLPDATETEELLNTALALHRDRDNADTDSLNSDDTKLGTPAPCKHCGHSSPSSFPSPIKNKDTSNDRLLTFALVLALVSLGLSIVSSLYTSAARSRQDATASPYSSAGTQGKALPRPNAYIGLERVQWPANASEIFKPIQSWPLSIWQMQSKDAKGSRAFLPEQDRHHFTKEGTVTPEDHRVVVDHKTSSILQFRALDWGMENCILHFSVPPLPVKPHTHAPGTEGEHESEEPHSLKDGPDPPPGSLFEQADIYANATIAPGTTLDIFWLGDTPSHEFLPTVYWGTAPKRIGEPVKRIVLTPGLNSGSHPFPCPSGTFPTFELACVDSADGCMADWWQDADRGPRAGFYIEQQWSKS